MFRQSIILSLPAAIENLRTFEQVEGIKEIRDDLVKLDTLSQSTHAEDKEEAGELEDTINKATSQLISWLQDHPFETQAIFSAMYDAAIAVAGMAPRNLLDPVSMDEIPTENRFLTSDRYQFDSINMLKWFAANAKFINPLTGTKFYTHDLTALKTRIDLPALEEKHGPADPTDLDRDAIEAALLEWNPPVEDAYLQDCVNNALLTHREALQINVVFSDNLPAIRAFFEKLKTASLDFTGSGYILIDRTEPIDFRLNRLSQISKIMDLTEFHLNTQELYEALLRLRISSLTEVSELLHGPLPASQIIANCLKCNPRYIGELTEFFYHIHLTATQEISHSLFSNIHHRLLAQIVPYIIASKLPRASWLEIILDSEGHPRPDLDKLICILTAASPYVSGRYLTTVINNIEILEPFYVFLKDLPRNGMEKFIIENNDQFYILLNNPENASSLSIIYQSICTLMDGMRDSGRYDFLFGPRGYELHHANDLAGIFQCFLRYNLHHESVSKFVNLMYQQTTTSDLGFICRIFGYLEKISHLNNQTIHTVLENVEHVRSIEQHLHRLNDSSILTRSNVEASLIPSCIQDLNLTPDRITQDQFNARFKVEEEPAALPYPPEEKYVDPIISIPDRDAALRKARLIRPMYTIVLEYDDRWCTSTQKIEIIRNLIDCLSSAQSISRSMPTSRAISQLNECLETSQELLRKHQKSLSLARNPWFDWFFGKVPHGKILCDKLNDMIKNELKEEKVHGPVISSKELDEIDRIERVLFSLKEKIHTYKDHWDSSNIKIDIVSLWGKYLTHTIHIPCRLSSNKIIKMKKCLEVLHNEIIKNQETLSAARNPRFDRLFGKTPHGKILCDELRNIIENELPVAKERGFLPSILDS